MILQCPECQRKIKPRGNAAPGQRVQVTCPCGQKLRFEVPRSGAPMPSFDALFRDIFGNKPW